MNIRMENILLNYTLAAVAAAVAIAVVLLLIRRHLRCGEWDDMDGGEFELYCADLLEKGGFTDVEVTKASHDYGVDILAEKDGVSYAFQCKCYTEPVGIKAVQEIYAGRDYYDCMVGVVMTNQYFTTPAVNVAKKLKIMLWDRGYLEAMMDER